MLEWQIIWGFIYTGFSVGINGCKSSNTVSTVYKVGAIITQLKKEGSHVTDLSKISGGLPRYFFFQFSYVSNIWDPMVFMTTWSGAQWCQQILGQCITLLFYIHVQWKPNSLPVRVRYCQLDSQEQTLVTIHSKYNGFLSWKCIWKWYLQNISDFVQAPVSCGETECEILQNIIGEVKLEIVSTLIFNISRWRNFCGMDKNIRFSWNIQVLKNDSCQHPYRNCYFYISNQI